VFPPLAASTSRRRFRVKEYCLSIRPAVTRSSGEPAPLDRAKPVPLRAHPFRCVTSAPSASAACSRSRPRAPARAKREICRHLQLLDVTDARRLEQASIHLVHWYFRLPKRLRRNF
jgi:hypothetical protein